MSPTNFSSSSYRFRYNNIKLLTYKKQVKSQSAILLITPVDAKFQNFTSVSPKVFRQLLPFHKYNNLIFDLKEVGQGHEVQCSQLHRSMENVIIYECLPYIFVLAFTISVIRKCLIFGVLKIDQGHRMLFSQLHLSMANFKIYKCHFLTFFIFAKVQPVLTKLTDTQTDTHIQKWISPQL